MSYFWQVFNYYRADIYGFIYMPLRWIINPFVEISTLMPKSGTLLDLGCGEGVMAVLLALSSSKRKVIGVDINQRKIKLGKLIARKIPNLTFTKQDLLTEKIQQADGFVLSDFLHHIPNSKHKQFLKKIAKATRKGGMIIIKDADTNEFIRSKGAKFWDFVFYPREKTYYWDAIKLKKLLNSYGLKVIIKRVVKYFPNSGTLYICYK